MPVTAGEHIIAVQVRAGSMGWHVLTAGGPQFDRFLQPAAEDAPAAPGWEYVGVAGDLVFGTADGTAFFAAEKDTGARRWLVPARHNIPPSAVAVADDRVFYFDASTLVALDHATGRELWRREKVPAILGSSPSVVQVSQGVVVANAGLACEAATGRVLWQQTVFCGRMPVIHGEWVVAQPFAYHLKTGQRRTTTDPLTGEERPRQFARSYGCSSVAGCRNLLFFQSTTLGFYDWEREVTANFGGARPNCSVSMIAANGLMLLREASAACSCSYNFQTSLALVPDTTGAEPWYASAGERDLRPVRQLRVDFRAPGDRRDTAGNLWFAWPRPQLTGVYPLSLAASNNTLTVELAPADTPERAFTVRLTGPPGWRWTVGSQTQTATTGVVEFPNVTAGRFLTIRGSALEKLELLEERR